MIKEIWQPIKGFEGYDVSNKGNIRTYHKKRGRYGYVICKNPVGLIKTRLDAYGYVIVTLSRGKKHYTKKVHRLTLQAFVGDCPRGMECCHNDDKKANNYVGNLRWDTRKNNKADMIIHNTIPKGEKHHSAKLKNVDIINIRNLWLQGTYQNAIANKYHTSQQNISRIVNRKRWKCV